MQILDWIVIGIYAAGMLAVGAYFSRKSKTSEDYLLGGRRMRSWTVGLSLFASLFSAISYLSVPGEVIKFGPMLLCGLLAYPFAYIVVGWFLIPAIMETKVSSAYELLEIRLGVKIRVFASLLFLVLRLLWMSLIIYMCAVKVVVPIMGWPESAALWVGVVMVVLTTAYTSMGGLRAVVFTDVVQTLILFGAAVCSVILINRRLGGVSTWFPNEWPDGWLEWKIFDTKARISAGTAFLSVFTWQVCVAGSDQMSIQRYLATRNVKAARRGYLTQLITSTLVWIVLGFLGLALMSYFRTNPQLLPTGATSISDCADVLFPRFILVGLPVGVTGIVIAGLLAAAMSSLSSGVNSSCLAISKDFIGRFRKKKVSESAEVRIAKITSLAVGIIVILLSLIIGNVKGNLLDLSYKTNSIFIAPFFVPFFMAFYFRRAGEFATFIGTIASVIASILISFSAELFGSEHEISIMWIMPIALVTGIAVSVLVHLIRPNKDKT